MTGTTDDRIRDQALAEALQERYLAYAMSTIVARSLPDVRDGLKPVHRRLLYAMRVLKLDPDQGFKKCARVVGDVIGKFHPHGDTAVYDALVRLAQDFAVRYPLVEGQGNFGNVDGDNAAAMRYTESRLTGVAMALMEGLDEDAVDFRATYDSEDEEPVVMPGGFPNLLANGASGIAVGMATNIPPHNVGELCAALRLLLAQPDCGVVDVLAHVKGPDFPTGGLLAETPETIREAYITGRGSMRVRARWAREDLGHGTYQIVVTEVPYQVPKARLVERIADLIHSKKLPLLADVRDESAEDIRLILEPRSRTVDPEQLMEHLYRLTDLESRFAMNMNVLGADGAPRVMDLKQVLHAFLEHRHEVLLRRTQHRLAKIAHRLEVLDGYLVAYLNLDEVIRIIREEDEAKAVLMTTFALTDVQAEAILNMRLRALRRLEEEGIRKEHKTLSIERKNLNTLLKEPEKQRKVLDDQVAAMHEAFADPRRTSLTDAPSAMVVPLEAMVEREPITVVLSAKGWVRAMKGHLDDAAEARFKENDSLHTAVRCHTTDKLLILASTGRMYTLGCDRLPSGRGFGEPVRLMLDIPEQADLTAVLLYHAGQKLLVASAQGRGFVVAADEVVAQTKAGRQVLNVSDAEQATHCHVIAEGADSVAVVGTHRKLLVFALNELPEMARGRGVILMKLKDATLSDIQAFRAADGLSWTTGAGTRVERDLLPWQGKRAGAGRLPPHGFPRSNRFSNA